MRDIRIAKGLGYFSIGLGLAELIAPRWLGRLIGAGDEHKRLLQMFGVREIAAGVAILASPRPAKGLWARIAGDALDLAALFAALSGSTQRGRVAGALGAVAGVSALDIYTAQRMSRAPFRAMLPS
jgi:hypothetical protein